MGKQAVLARPRQEDSGPVFEESVIKVNRTAKVIKGGRRFSFSALVVVGNRSGTVGSGFGKAREVPSAVEKGVKDAKKNLFKAPLRGSTIEHEVLGRYGASRVRLIPAAPGTGIIAGASVRAVLELAGVKDILTKAYGSTNPINLAKAAIVGLKTIRPREQVMALRGRVRKDASRAEVVS
ncbi:MAG: 30S ribosomal protein S5 [Planctomycetota bacterium]